MTEDDTYVLDALGGARDGEPVVAAQWFQPLGAADNTHGGFRRAVRRLLGGGDGLPAMGVLAVTPTRLLMLDATTDWSGFAVRETLETWPLAEIRLSSRRRTAVQRLDNRHLPDMRLTVVALPDGREIELPRGPMVSRLLSHAHSFSRLAVA
jgi:hypothetical protein